MMNNTGLAKAVITALFLLLILPISKAQPNSSYPDNQFQTINPENVTIVRDQWGVPHIYGNTDAEAAYGLAYANAEDDFKTMQELLLA